MDKLTNHKPLYYSYVRRDDFPPRTISVKYGVGVVCLFMAYPTHVSRIKEALWKLN